MPKRKKLDSGRPWLLGTDEIPPPLRTPWQMWSKSSDPHQQGLIQFEFTEEGLTVAWFPDGLQEKNVIPWDELAWASGQNSPDLRRELEFIKEKAQDEGLRWAKEQFVKDMRVKITEIGLIVQQTENPFLTKYAEQLTRIIKETEATLQ